MAAKEAFTIKYFITFARILVGHCSLADGRKPSWPAAIDHRSTVYGPVAQLDRATAF